MKSLNSRLRVSAAFRGAGKDSRSPKSSTTGSIFQRAAMKASTGKIRANSSGRHENNLEGLATPHKVLQVRDVMLGGIPLPLRCSLLRTYTEAAFALSLNTYTYICIFSCIVPTQDPPAPGPAEDTISSSAPVAAAVAAAASQAELATLPVELQSSPSGAFSSPQGGGEADGRLGLSLESGGRSESGSQSQSKSEFPSSVLGPSLSETAARRLAQLSERWNLSGASPAAAASSSPPPPPFLLPNATQSFMENSNR